MKGGIDKRTGAAVVGCTFLVQEKKMCIFER
jgi:hypothetical protein